MSAAEEITENLGTNDGSNEEQKPQESDPSGEIAEEPTQPLDQNGGDIGEDSAQATEADKEGDGEKGNADEKEDKEEKGEVVDTNNDPAITNSTEEITESPVEEKTQEEDPKMEEPAMSVVISEPDKDVKTQEANAQTEGRESPVGEADVSAASPGKVENKATETQSESESPLVAPPTSKADRSIDSETPMKNTRDQLEAGGIARDGFAANGKLLIKNTESPSYVHCCYSNPALYCS